MAVIEPLTEEECYLWAIIQDESGVDLAEFTWVDWEQSDRCFRCYPFQVVWWRHTDKYQVDHSARSIGKSLSIKARAYVFPLIHPGGEMVITAPEGIHLDAITDVIETAFKNTRLGEEVLLGGRQGFKHRPFHASFKNGARIMGRIPHRDGSGVKGTHPLWLEMDEAQDYPHAGWTEINETLKRGIAGATWRIHGVTKGLRDDFFEVTKADSGFKVHRISAMWRPTWTAKEREDAVRRYGSEDDPDYRRNLLGEHGDAMSPIFVLYRLLSCADDNQESTYNQDEYMHIKIHGADLESPEDAVAAIDLPMLHTQKYKTFWAGMDVGLTNHPSEILIFAEEVPKGEELRELKKLKKASPPEGMPRLKLILRVSLQQVSAPDQVQIITYLVRHYGPQAFSIDKTGLGLPIFQDLQTDETIKELIKGYGFSEKVLVDFDQTLDVPEGLSPEELAKAAGIKKNVPDYATDVLRYLVDSHRLWLPWDTELIDEFSGQTYKVVKSGLNAYGKRAYSAGAFHALDAARLAALGWKQYALEALMKAKRSESVLDVFMY